MRDKMKKIFPALAVIFMLTTISACKKPGETSSSSGTSDEAIKKYILAHPEVLVESLNSYQKQEAEQQGKKTEEELSKRTNEVYNNLASPVVGNPNGKTVIVEFFDYNCHYCKAILPDLQRIIAENKDVKVIFKEVPFLGETSASTAIAALIVYDTEPEKYFAFHTALMEHQGPADNNSIAAAAQKVGIDPAKLEQSFKDKKYENLLSENFKLAQALGISGTPTFIINGKVARGAIQYEKMKELIGAKQ